MIKSILIKDGLLKEKFGRYKTFNFTDKLNIIWGNNTSGKTLLTNTLAHYCNIPYNKGGWTNTESLYKIKSNDTNISYTKILHENSPHGRATVDWDKSPSYYISNNTINNKENFMDTAENFQEYINQQSLQSSLSGEQNIYNINKLLKLEIPNILSKLNKQNNLNFYNELYLKHISNIDNTKIQKSTIIIDNIDNSLDLTKQFYLIKKFLKKLLDKFQIIYTSKSIISLLDDEDINLIDIDNSSKDYKQFLSNAFYIEEKETIEN